MIGKGATMDQGLRAAAADRPQQGMGGLVTLLRLSSALLIVAFANTAILAYLSEHALGLDIRLTTPIMAGLLAVGITGFVLYPYLRAFSGFALFVALNLYFAAASIWAPPSDIVAEKTFATLIVPPLCFVAGLVAALTGGVRTIAFFTAALAIVTAAVYVGLGHTNAMLESALFPLGINYQHFGYVFAFGLVGAAYCAATAGSGWVRLFWLATIGVCAWFVIASGSRGALLMALAALAAWFVADGWRKPWALALGAAAALVGIVIIGWVAQNAAMLAADPDAPATLRRLSYFLFVRDPETSSQDYSREFLGAAAFEAGVRAPIFGVGWGGFPSAIGVFGERGHYPHNLPLEIWAETGIVGLLLLGFVSVAFLREWRAANAPRLLNLFILGMLAAQIAQSLVSNQWPDNRLLFALFGLMTGLAVVAELNSSAEQGARVRRSFAAAG
jgi:O-antigen ligase